MKNWLVKTFGLKGSWAWAVHQMKSGAIIRPSGATGSVRYRLSPDGQNRVEWTFSRDATSESWENANLFASDFESSDWTLA